MLPFRLSVPLHITLKTHIILIIQPSDNGLPGHLPGQFPAFFFLYQRRTEIFHKIFVSAPVFQVGVLRLGSGQILISVRFKVSHDKAVEQRIDTADNITHFPVFLFQPILFPSRPDQQDNNINRK